MSAFTTPQQPVAPQQTSQSLTVAQEQPQYRIPDIITFTNITKIAITEDKPIMMDYWLASLEKKALIGVRENNEKLLVKSNEEYTSPIQKIFRAGNEYIIMTENSLYIVDNKIMSRRIT